MKMTSRIAAVVMGLASAWFSFDRAAAQTPPPEIVELARALKNDPDLIYEYVYNNIETVPIHGSLKGPIGTLVDGKGTSFDQAELMVLLLQEAALTNTTITNPRYETGSLWLTQSQLANWLGVDNSRFGVAAVLSGARIPAVLVNSGSLNVCAAITSSWVKVSISGVDYVFDPASKLANQPLAQLQGQAAACIPSGAQPAALGYTRSAGVDLAAATGYSPSAFISAAQSGATITSTSVAGLNRTNVRNNLATYSTNLVSWIRANAPAASTKDIIGGRTINPLTVGLQQRWTALPYVCTTAQNAGCTSVVTTSAMDSAYRTTLRITVPGASAVTFNSSDIYGRRLTVFFNGSNQPVLALDGVVQATGTAVSPGNNVALATQIVHPFASSGTQNGTLNVPSGGSYLIANGWGGVSRGMIERHRRLLLQAEQQTPGASSSEPVLGESLSVMANTWMGELNQASELIQEVSKVQVLLPHNVGIAGVKTISSGVGPFVDLPLNTAAQVQLIARPNVSITSLETAVFYASGGVASVLESGIIEQTQPDLEAVSTVKLLDNASQTDTIYDINNSNVSGNDQSYWTNSIKPLFQTYYTTTIGAADLARINTIVVSNNLRVIAALHGPQTINQWSGSGYFQITQTGLSIGAIISGGLSGGYTTAPKSVSSFNGSTRGAQIVSNGLSGGVTPVTATSGLRAISPTGPVSIDPVDLVSGAFISDHDDLAVGSGSQPYGLSFTRQYNSASRLAPPGTLGLGWVHNFVGLAKADSDGYAGMAADSPISGASGIAAIMVLKDILDGGSTAKPLDRIVIAAQIERWLMDQLTGNAVSVIQGASSLQFVKLADGTYNAPFRSNAALTVVSGLYRVTAADKTQWNFNSAGNLSTVVYPTGPTLTYTYNGSNQLTSVANGMGRTLTLSYTSGKIASVSDGTRSVSYTYDAASNLTAYQDPLGNSVTYAYDAPGRLTKIFFPTFPTNAFVTNTYSGLDRVNVQQDANGKTTYLYLTGTRAETIDPTGASDTLYMTPRGETRLRIDALGNKTVNAYDGLNRLTSTTFPELNSVSYVYDNLHGPTALQNVLSTIISPKPGSGSPTLTTSYTYDSTFQKVQTATDARGATTTYFYDVAGGTGSLLQIDQPIVDGQTPRTLLTYNARGQVATKVDPTGKVTLNTYDSGTEALLSVTDDNGALKIKTQFGYDAVGNVTSVTDPRNNVTTMTYDAARRVKQVTAPTSTNAVTKTTYNADGLATLTERATGNGAAPWQSSSATYSKTGKVLTATDPNGNVTTYTYDDMDRLASVKDAVNRITTTSYDALGRVVGQSNGAIQAAPLVSYSYTPNGFRKTLTDANNNRSTYIYDGLDRLTSLQYPSATRGAGVSDTANTEGYTYDANGNVLTRKKRDGSVITWTYDVLNRPLTKQYPGHVNDVYYAYDLAGRMLSARYGSTSGVGVIYAYDTAGRLASETTNGQAMSFAYDAAGNRTRMTWPDAFYVTYDYDAANRMTAVRENGAASGPGVLAVYTYDPLSRMTAGALGDGATVAYGYDAADRLTALTHTMPTGGSAFNQTLGFSYTAANQLQGRTATNAAYDWSNYVTGTTSNTADGLNRDAATAALSGGYDASGNVTNDGARTFTYDFDNRLTAASITASSTTVTLAYDSASRLRQQQTTVGAGAMVTTDYLYGGSGLSAEYDGSGTLLRRYVHGVGIDNPLVWYEGAGVTDRRWLHADERGSIVAYSNISGSVTGQSYGPYGEPTAWGGSRFAYTGQIQIAEVQLYHYKARVYDPVAGRFSQTDPIGYSDDVNLYAYVGGDPINLADPLGLAAAFGLSTPTRYSTSTPGAFQIAQNSRAPSPGYTQYSIGADVGIAAVIPGMSIGVQIGVSIPNGNTMRGAQIFVSPSITPTLGIGAFAGAGLSGSIGSTSRTLPLVQGSVTPVVTGKVGVGPSIEVTKNLGTPGGSVGLPVPKTGAGFGAYLGIGPAFSGTLATPPLDY